jgi:hypothetical protein
VLLDELYEKIKIAFGNRETKPDTIYEFKKFYFGLLRNIFGGILIGIIDSKRTMDKNKVKYYKYNFKDGIIRSYHKLYSQSDIIFVDEEEF